MLQKELERKNEQLAVKDKQIAELNARLSECSAAMVSAQQTAQAAQALHAGTIRQQFFSGEAGANQQGGQEPILEQRRSWLDRLFGKG